MRRLLLVIAVLAGLSVSQDSRAQARRIIIEETVIEGKVQKPEITIFISRQNLDTDYILELRESFIPKIVKSVEKKPF